MKKRKYIKTELTNFKRYKKVNFKTVIECPFCKEEFDESYFSIPCNTNCPKCYERIKVVKK